MMSRETGQQLTEIEHIKQSLADLISTPIGSRLMRRRYGTKLANLLDQPTSEALFLKCCSTIYTAILLWEPRVEISRLYVSEVNQGKTVLNLEGTIVQSGESLNMNIPLIVGALT
ncbi:GPW/gp25 family protein [Acinetobacter schindleri]|uniref:GPW/gp25 family protein n=1 Tax=Acinetobacter schindleri TaxID=108981 RepID=UPI0016119BC5|nr:GPW/gp25 family protein [Acinetobacter schindleri]MBB4835467.1 phage baseplate assembly protein W [Acinetobacter schindleri]WDE16895.1 GPW/gp25 family protein [Acinetobacter schindleri]